MKILFFGLTGSIGQSYLKDHNHHKIVGFSYNNNEILAKKLIKKYKIKYYYSSSQKLSNTKSIDDLIEKTNPDLIVNAVSGYDGLAYTLKAIQFKKNIALANKESLVMAGNIITKLIKKYNLKLFPIDSEHSSLYELFMRSDINKIKKLYITCSGGSCYNKTKNELNNIKYKDVIKHPNWNMGEKISFDSATLINKCFEIVEAYYLFNFKNIEALYHKQSIVHSLIEYKDNTIFANMSHPDMAISLSLATNNFIKKDYAIIKPLSFKQLNISFEEIDMNRFKPIKWAYDIINDKNHCLGTIINFANEKAINLFKQNKIKFTDFYNVIEYYIKKYSNYKIKNVIDIYKLLEILKIDKQYN